VAVQIWMRKLIFLLRQGVIIELQHLIGDDQLHLLKFQKIPRQGFLEQALLVESLYVVLKITIHNEINIE
jgi:hypothetical protein